jgi:hypothetical protein
LRLMGKRCILLGNWISLLLARMNDVISNR